MFDCETSQNSSVVVENRNQNVFPRGPKLEAKFICGGVNKLNERTCENEKSIEESSSPEEESSDETPVVKPPAIDLTNRQQSVDVDDDLPTPRITNARRSSFSSQESYDNVHSFDSGPVEIIDDEGDIKPWEALEEHSDISSSKQRSTSGDVG